MTEGEIATGQEIDIGGFVSTMNAWRDKRTLSTELPFSCTRHSSTSVPLKEFSRTHSRNEKMSRNDAIASSTAFDYLNRSSDESMFTGLAMFRKEKGGMPICGTVDFLSQYMGESRSGESGGSTSRGSRGSSSNGAGNQCTNLLSTSCDHTSLGSDPNGEHRLVMHDTLVLNTSMTTRVLDCHPETSINTNDATRHPMQHFIRMQTKRRSTFANNTILTVRGDLFAKKKTLLRGQFDFVASSTTVRTTLDLRDDINVGDLLGVRLPGGNSNFESVVLSRPDELTLVLGQTFPANLMGYSGHLVYVRQSMSGRSLGTRMGQGTIMKSEQSRVITMDPPTPTPHPHPSALFELRIQVDSALEAKALCKDIEAQYHALIRFMGTTVLTVSEITPHSIQTDQMYCNDDFLGTFVVLM